MTHYIVTDNDHIRIYGLGNTLERAIKDSEWTDGWVVPLRAVPATKTLFNAIKNYGNDISWSVIDGVAYTDDEAAS